MKAILIFLFFIPTYIFSQKKHITSEGQGILNTIPIENGQVIYEKVFKLDSINNKDKVFNSVKAALIKNTNYRYTRIDEDRVSGNLSSEISFQFSAKPGIAKIVLSGKGLLSIDVKENRFRVRIMNNTAEYILMNVPVIYEMPATLKGELELVSKNKWKVEKSVIVPWDQHLRIIIEAFGVLISKNITDDF